MEKKLHDKELGTITIRRSSKATRYVLKIAGGVIVATMPLKGDEKKMLAFINESREKLIKKLKQHPEVIRLINEETKLQTNTFTLRLFRSERVNFYMTLHDGILNIACPKQTDFENANTQTLLKSFIEQALRHEAKRILPTRLRNLAIQYTFTHAEIKINSSKTRWGSCSMQKNINLSFYLMHLPTHLIDYVLLHELCHTVEMNHGERFWALLDSVTENRAKALRKELKTKALSFIK